MAVGLYSGVSGLALGIGLYRNVSGLWGGASGLINGFGGADPYAGASLYLNFLDPVLDPRITFSRGTNATLIDSTGRLTYAPNNLVLQSQAFDNASWARTGTVTITADAGAAPDGTNTADRFVSTGGSFPQMAQSVTIPAGNYVLSLWVRSDGTTQIQQSIIFDGITVNFTPTATWERVQVVKIGSTGGSRSIVIATNSGSAPASSFFLWGAQLEAVTYQTTPSTYVATTASAYYGPRFDYDPVTLAPRGLLIEEARTNLLIYSAQFDTGWATVNTTVAANATTSPDGTVNADKITPTATVAAHQIAQSSGTLTVGTVYTASAFVKAAGYNFVDLTGNTPNANFLAQFNLSTGSVVSSTNVTGTPTIQNFGNGWYRIVASFTCATATGGFYYIQVRDNSQALSYAGDGTSGVFAYGAQLEAGSFATSYTPTVTSTVTRNADVATMTGTNFSSWYNQSEGTFVTGVSATAGSARALTASAGAVTNQLWLQAGAAAEAAFQVYTAGAFVAQLALLGSSASKVIAGAYKVNDFAAAIDGGAVATDTSGNIGTFDRLNIGARFDGTAGFLNGHIRTIAYFNTRLPNAQLQTLTAPSLATTLSLDFTSGSYNVGF